MPSRSQNSGVKANRRRVVRRPMTRWAKRMRSGMLTLLLSSARGFERLGRLAIGLGRPDKSGEQRVRVQRARLELGVELTAQVPWVVGDLDDLDQPTVDAQARQPQAVFLEHVAILVVDLVAVAVALAELLGIVKA